MAHKDHYIKIRVTAQTKQLFQQVAQREGLDISKLLRTLIHNYERPFTLSDKQVEMLRNNFANTARLGGLLNQIAYHLNSENLHLINTDSPLLVELDASKLRIICRDLNSEVRTLKSQISDMCKNNQVV